MILKINLHITGVNYILQEYEATPQYSPREERRSFSAIFFFFFITTRSKQGKTQYRVFRLTLIGNHFPTSVVLNKCQ